MTSFGRASDSDSKNLQWTRQGKSARPDRNGTCPVYRAGNPTGSFRSGWRRIAEPTISYRMPRGQAPFPTTIVIEAHRKIDVPKSMLQAGQIHSGGETKQTSNHAPRAHPTPPSKVKQNTW